MGHKVNPTVFRLANRESGVDWESKWFVSKKDYPKLVVEDLKIREFLEGRLRSAGLVMIKIERVGGKMKVIIVVARPGLVIGRGGKGLEEIKKALSKLVSVPDPEKDMELEVEEFKNADLSARVVGQRIADQLVRRMPYRRIINQAMNRVMAMGAKGVKIVLKGRINGIEISRKEGFQRGQVSLSTLREKIDYAQIPVLTRSGYIGLKVYINRKA